MRRATTTLPMVAVMVIVATAAVSVTKDWLVTWGLRVGIGDCNARLRSRLMVHNVWHYALDPRFLTATAREVSIVEHGQSGLKVLIYVSSKDFDGHLVLRRMLSA
jgi:hypothetical protein